jgi:hypothetical protein
MSVPNKIEAVKKLTETMTKQQSPVEPERVAPNKEQFQSLMNTAKPGSVTGSERLDTKVQPVNELEESKNPIIADESVTSQKSGSATDQEKKRQKGSQSDEVEGVGATGSKKTVSDETASLMEEVSKLNKSVSTVSHGTPESIKSQAKTIISELEQAKTKVTQSATEIKPSYQTLLKNRLTHIDDNLKIALSKAGVEYTPSTTTQPTKGTSPLHRFIDSITSSQSQLDNLQTAIDRLNVPGQTIEPAQMMAIQLKMNYVQQQVELFSNLLNKALESAKTVMNVQV